MWRLGLVGLSAVALCGCVTDMANTTKPPGDLAAYTPFALVPKVAAYAGKAPKLVKMTALRVPANGKIPFSSDGRARVDHTFVTNAGGDYFHVTVEVKKPRIVLSSRGASNRKSKERHLGMGRNPAPMAKGATARIFEVVTEKLSGVNVKAPAPKDVYAKAPNLAPKCSAAELWKQAIAAGASAKALADISYGVDGYELAPGGGSSHHFDHDCKPKSP